MKPQVRIAIWARPGSSTESIAWDPWRNAWQVRVREPPVAGQANRAILLAIARWLAVPEEEVRWVQAGRSSSKVAVVEGLDTAEVQRRLSAAQRAAPSSEG